MVAKKNIKSQAKKPSILHEPDINDTVRVIEKVDDEKQHTIACTGYDFRISETYENKKLSVQDIRDMLQGIAQHYVFQLEKGEQNGYIHYQGRMRLIKKTTLNHLKSLFRNKETCILPNWLKPTIKGEYTKKTFNYQIKEDTRLEGPYTDKDVLETDDSKLSLEFLSKKYDVLMHLTSEEALYPYQKKVRDSGLMSNRDLRCIDILYDNRGYQGKSTTKDYMDITKRAVIIPPTGDSIKLMEAAYCMLYTRMQEIELKPGEIFRPGVIIIDIPRAIKTAELYSFYGVLEQLKGGIAYDFRNKFRRIRFQPPRIWVFTNTLPPENCLSEDRLRIWTINKDKDLEVYVREPNPVDKSKDDLQSNLNYLEEINDRNKNMSR